MDLVGRGYVINRATPFSFQTLANCDNYPLSLPPLWKSFKICMNTNLHFGRILEAVIHEKPDVGEDKINRSYDKNPLWKEWRLIHRKYWNCTDTGTVLTLYWHCTDTDTILTLCGHCTNTVLTLYWHCTDTILILCGHCTNTVLTLYWHCTDTVLKLYCHCTATLLTLCWNWHCKDLDFAKGFGVISRRVSWQQGLFVKFS